MTYYEATLLLGIVLFVWGVLRFFRQLTGGDLGGFSVLLMMGGGFALFVANSFSPEGVKITDVMPAIMHLVTSVRTAVM